MNGRRLYREYLIYKGYDAKGFVKITEEYYSEQVITYTNSKGVELDAGTCVKEMMEWVRGRLTITTTHGIIVYTINKEVFDGT